MAMMEPGLDVVTGAFSRTGRFIAERLLAQGRRVRTLTNHPQRAGAEEIKVDVAPLQFTDRTALVESLRGADVLYNTYWIRLPAISGWPSTYMLSRGLQAPGTLDRSPMKRQQYAR